MSMKTTKVGNRSEALVAAFLKRFFTPLQVAEIKKLEYTIWDVWKTDPGRVLRRGGYSVRDHENASQEKLWRLFFVKELRFELVDGWRRSAEGRKFEKTVKRYRALRSRLASSLNPTGARIRVEGDESPLKTALSHIEF